MSDLQKTLEKLRKRHDTKIGAMSDVAEDVVGLSTGNVAIDYLTGVGGIPMGRIVEIFGPPSSGKTTCALQAIVQMQKAGLGRKVVYFDYEQAMDKRYAEALGCRIDDIIFTQPDTLEEGADICLELIRTGEIGLMVFDSVAGMIPSALAEADVGKSLPAIQARQMSHFLQILKGEAKEQNCAVIFLNHVREMIGINGPPRPGLPPKMTTPGGNALKYYASTRIEFKRITDVREETEDDLTMEKTKRPIATLIRASIPKNKVGEPFRQAELRVTYGKGFSQAYSVLKILMAYNQISKETGGVFRMKSPLLEDENMSKNDKGAWIKGETNVLIHLEENPQTLSRWAQVAISCLQDKPKDIITAEVPELIEGSPSELESLTVPVKASVAVPGL